MRPIKDEEPGSIADRWIACEVEDSSGKWFRAYMNPIDNESIEVTEERAKQFTRTPAGWYRSVLVCNDRTGMGPSDLPYGNQIAREDKIRVRGVLLSTTRRTVVKRGPPPPPPKVLKRGPPPPPKIVAAKRGPPPAPPKPKIGKRGPPPPPKRK